VEKAIEVLMGEHRLIEQTLGSLETYSAEVRAGAPVERGVVGDYAAFLRGFADACHHAKEEDILFLRMVQRGLPQESGPIAVMRYEHEVGRAHVRVFAEIAARPERVAFADAPEFLANAEAYVRLLRQHILKEDRVLYPMALQVFTAPELDAMNSEFEELEALMRADGSYDRLRGLADRLTSRFRPDPARMAAADRLVPCAR
jgi:hemerythrin-like domain-containing protein